MTPRFRVCGLGAMFTSMSETEDIGLTFEYGERKCTISDLRMLQASMLGWKKFFASQHVRMEKIL
mgnify:CR=1 FL=1